MPRTKIYLDHESYLEDLRQEEEFKQKQKEGLKFIKACPHVNDPDYNKKFDDVIKRKEKGEFTVRPTYNTGIEYQGEVWKLKEQKTILMASVNIWKSKTGKIKKTWSVGKTPHPAEEEIK